MKICLFLARFLSNLQRLKRAILVFTCFSISRVMMALPGLAMYILADGDEDRFLSITSVPFIKWDRWQPCFVLLDAASWSWLVPFFRSRGDSRAYFSEGKKKEVNILLGKMSSYPQNKDANSLAEGSDVDISFVSGTRTLTLFGRWKAKILVDLLAGSFSHGVFEISLT